MQSSIFNQNSRFKILIFFVTAIAVLMPMVEASAGVCKDTVKTGTRAKSLKMIVVNNTQRMFQIRFSRNGTVMGTQDLTLNDKDHIKFPYKGDGGEMKARMELWGLSGDVRIAYCSFHINNRTNINRTKWHNYSCSTQELINICPTCSIECSKGYTRGANKGSWTTKFTIREGTSTSQLPSKFPEKPGTIKVTAR